MVEVKQLIDTVDAFLEGRIDAEKLEQFTMGIIQDDSFDSLDEGIQDLIYALDNKELNELTEDDVREIRDDLQRLDDR